MTASFHKEERFGPFKLFNVVPVPPQEVSGYVCSVLEVLILIFDFGIVPTFHFFPSYLLCRGFMLYYLLFY